MSTVHTTTAAIVIVLAIAAMRSAPALARGNFDRAGAWSHPTVHAATYNDYHAWSHPTVHVNYHLGYAGPVLFNGHHRDKRAH